MDECDIYGISVLYHKDKGQQPWHGQQQQQQQQQQQHLHTAPLEMDMRRRRLDLSNSFIRQLHTLGLPHLQQLDLSYNQLELISEGAFENLARLEALNLSRNALHNNVGRSARALRSVGGLRSLDLSRNNLDDVAVELYLRNKLSLRHLDLTGNGMTALTHNTFDECQGLKIIIAADNLIRDIEQGTHNMSCVAFGQMETLKRLNLEDNGIEMLYTNTFGKTSLAHLNLARNPRMVLEAGALQGVRGSLQTLSLSEINITSRDLSLPCMPALSQLNLSNNLLDAIPSGLSCSPLLRVLDVSNNALASMNRSRLRAMSSHLRAVHVRGNRFDCCDTSWLAVLNESRVNIPDFGRAECVARGDSVPLAAYLCLCGDKVVLTTDVLRFGPMVHNVLLAGSIAHAVQVLGATLSLQQLRRLTLDPGEVNARDVLSVAGQGGHIGCVQIEACGSERLSGLSCGTLGRWSSEQPHLVPWNKWRGNNNNNNNNNSSSKAKGKTGRTRPSPETLRPRHKVPGVQQTPHVVVALVVMVLRRPRPERWKGRSFAEENSVPDIGTLVVVFSSEKQCVEVLRLDYGDTAHVPLSSVGHLTPDMAVLPLQATRVSLADGQQPWHGQQQQQQQQQQQHLHTAPLEMDMRRRKIGPLDLSYNQLELISEGAFENLARLEALNLSRNALHNNVGRSARALRSVGGLRSLDLSRNNLDDVAVELYLRNKYSLRHLDLTGNGMTALTHNTFDECQGLKIIIAADNLIRDIERGTHNMSCVAFGQMETLKRLNLEDNGIEMLYTNTFGKTSLAHLNLARNPRMVLEAGALQGVRGSLQTLSLSEINITSRDLSLPCMPALSQLNLSNNLLDAIPSGLSCSPLLRVLDVSNNALASMNRSRLRAMSSHLRAVHVRGNRFDCCDTSWLAVLNESRVNIPDFGRAECVARGDSVPLAAYLCLCGDKVVLTTDVLRFGPMVHNVLLAGSIAHAVQVLGATLSLQQLRRLTLDPGEVNARDVLSDLRSSGHDTPDDEDTRPARFPSPRARRKPRDVLSGLKSSGHDTPDD
ncbi:hypothetical protein CRUP_001849 [Coryphaenoides rupestris]|nr:hypothetical protein CRUP_001849 [Coryphaenoides rupestris]